MLHLNAKRQLCSLDRCIARLFRFGDAVTRNRRIPKLFCFSPLRALKDGAKMPPMQIDHEFVRTTASHPAIFEVYQFIDFDTHLE